MSMSLRQQVLALTPTPAEAHELLVEAVWRVEAWGTGHVLATAWGALWMLAQQCHEAARTWYEDPVTGAPIARNHGEQFMLMVSEISEAMEGDRKDLMDDKLPHRKMVEVELADCLIRIFDFAGANQLDLDGAVAEKLAYNAQRADHKPENRVKAGGKKW